jgi:hypothetical protein
MNTNIIKTVVGVLLWIPLICFVGLRIFYDQVYEQNCGGHIERAAHANSIPTTEAELRTALNYIEAHGLTHGYTSVTYQTPDEDVGFWYANLKAGLTELEGLGPQSNPLEQSNVLMRLREALSKTPSGISVFPDNKFYAWFGWLSGLGLVVGCILFVFGTRDWWE